MTYRYPQRIHKLGLQLLLIPVIFLHTVLAKAEVVTINFDDLNDGDILTTQYPGVKFSNAVVLAAGISLNEFEFPPHSAPNVISDNGRLLSIAFSTPVTSISGYFTYAEPLILTGFSTARMTLAISTSSFSSNEAFSGDLGSQPNELLKLTSQVGIAEVTISGDPNGGSFVLDDLAYSSPVSSPEPASPILIAMGITALALKKKLKLRL